jgi:Cu/Ag efflux protein CusF
MKTKSLFLAALLSVAAAMPAAAQGGAPASGTAAQSTGKRYHLEGKIVSVRASARQAVIDAKAIPGFMSAMSMPYTFKDSADLAKLKAGDNITADIVIEGSKTWLENVKTVSDAGPAKKE